jgi:hypothetical protein
VPTPETSEGVRKGTEEGKGKANEGQRGIGERLEGKNDANLRSSCYIRQPVLPTEMRLLPFPKKVPLLVFRDFALASFRHPFANWFKSRGKRLEQSLWKPLRGNLRLEVF